MKKLFIFIFLLFPSMLFAESNNNNFIIDNIFISRIDKDATTAREKAIHSGQRKAFNIILDRLNIDSSNGIIINDNEISQTLRSMQIKNEKITNNSYSANLMLEFSPEYINFILNKYKISKYSPYFDSYLIIPVLKENGKIYLWEKNNNWINSFNKNIKNYNNIFTIQYDFLTKNLLDKDFFFEPEFNNFNKLNNIYYTNNIVVVVGEENKQSNLLDIKIYVLNKEKTVNAYLTYQINSDNINNNYIDAAIEIMEYIKNISDNNVDKMTFNIIDRNNNYVDIYSPISSIQDFMNVKNKLSVNKNINEINLKAISKKLAIFTIKYADNSNLELLIQSLKDHGFTVSEKKYGIYVFLN